MVSGLVSVVLSLGGVAVTVASTAVFNATATVVDGAPQNSATGVPLVLVAGILFTLATVTATVLVRKRFPRCGRRRGGGATPGCECGADRSTTSSADTGAAALHREPFLPRH